MVGHAANAKQYATFVADDSRDVSCVLTANGYDYMRTSDRREEATIMKRTVQWLAATMTLVLPLMGSHGHVAGSADSVVKVFSQPFEGGLFCRY